MSEILTPRVDLVAVEDDATMEEAASLFVESGYSRLPIYHDSIDNIIGVIHEKDFYAARYRGETDLTNLKAPVLYTTGNTKISELLRILQKNKAHMAVVVDEYGGTEGIATLEDIVEMCIRDRVCSSVNVGSTKAGIDMDAVALMGRTIKDLAQRTADQGGFGCAKLVVFCNAVEDNPFMAGAFHGVGEPCLLYTSRCV